MGLVILITMATAWGLQRIVRDSVDGRVFGLGWRLLSASTGLLFGAFVYAVALETVASDAPFTDSVLVFWASSSAICAYMGWAALPARATQ